jgi:hypothetical protein
MHATDTKALSTRRAKIMKVIARARADGGALPPLLEKARGLMSSRYWARANWRHRAQIVAASEWLLKLAERSGEIGTTGLF